ncbi:M56 family metallopeptidase [Verrucomicrobium sp. BvORR034]|uniref:M56 family metallopeptidase n=1 Tax=Verrucomicrobium sp. BvORR034 TaxID=1396418 RepID=UPI00067943C1|nr:M56 family metallopeptidase [Verrucomicrobium sp. BvORR034]
MNADLFLTTLEKAGAWAGHTSLVMLPALALLVVLGWWGRFPARVRLLLGALFLVRLLLPAVPSLPSHPLGWLERSRVLSVSQEAVRQETPGEFVKAGIESQLVSSMQQPVEQGAASTWPAATTILTGLWAAGVVGVAGWAAASHVMLWRMVRQRGRAAGSELEPMLAWAAHRLGGARRPALLEVPGLPTVALWGWVRPCILVPSKLAGNYTEDEIRGMFLHELAHVKRQDVLWGWAGLAVAALHWCNPLVWLMLRRLRADRELECDRVALEAMDGEQRVSYGMALLKTLENHLGTVRLPATAGAALMPFGKRQPEIQKRILMIASPLPSPWWHRAALALVPMLTLVTFTTAQADGEAPKEPAAKEDGAPREGGVKEGDKGNKEAVRDGEGVKKGPRDGEGVKKGPRDGDGGKQGLRDGDGVKKGPRDGEGGKQGVRDGEGKKAGARDGEMKKAGLKDGDQPRKEGDRDGKAGAAEGKRGAADGEAAVRGKVARKDRIDLLVGVLADGSFTANGQDVTEEVLLAKLKQQAANGRDQVVKLQATPETAYKHVTRALELCQQANVVNVGILQARADVGNGDGKGSR